MSIRSRRARVAAIVFVLVLGAIPSLVVFSQRPTADYVYVFPRPGAKYINVGATIALRHGDKIDTESLTASQVQVVGSRSGLHTGKLIVADDGVTLIFQPDAPFSPGETVSVAVGDGVRTATGVGLNGPHFSFETSVKASPGPSPAARLGVDATTPETAVAGGGLTPTYRTIPGVLPQISVTVPASGTAEGLIFLANFRFFNFPFDDQTYNLIYDNDGQLIYAQQFPTGTITADFKKQEADGTLTYFHWVDQDFKALDNGYNLVKTYTAGNGFATDLHELIVLPNGHALLMIYDTQPVDMSVIVPGGDPNALVIGLVIQELDTSGNVVFEWHSWDDIPITDTNRDVTASMIDYVHGNAIEMDTDGNLIISSRHLDELTKIDRQTGDIIWRLGGKANEFTYVTGDEPFFGQHDGRRMTNGHLSLFDNQWNQPSPRSRSAEYVIDEVSKTLELVWEFYHPTDAYAFAMGSSQNLPNGNKLIGWGNSHPTLTEVRPNGTIAFEMDFEPTDFSYRAFRYPWEGAPAYPAALVGDRFTDTIDIYFSWNGATDVSAYEVYGGPSPEPTTLLATVPKTDFEEKYTVTGVGGSSYYIRVMPLDGASQPTMYSQDYISTLMYFPAFPINPQP